MMTALILVDIQNDFLPGGALAVPNGDQVIPVADTLIAKFPLVIATQDWHPRNHASFASNHHGRKLWEQIDLHGLPQTLWPDHCIQNTPGAAFAPTLNTARITKVFPKGEDPTIDSYSGFYDNGRRRSTGLADWLRKQGVTSVVICGLATDYCVAATAIDAATEGFHTTVILDAIRGVELKPGDCATALERMRAAGVTLKQTSELDP